MPPRHSELAIVPPRRVKGVDNGNGKQSRHRLPWSSDMSDMKDREGNEHVATKADIVKVHEELRTLKWGVGLLVALSAGVLGAVIGLLLLEG